MSFIVKKIPSVVFVCLIVTAATAQDAAEITKADITAAQSEQKAAKAAADKAAADLRRLETQLRDKTRQAENTKNAVERDERSRDNITAQLAKAKEDLANNTKRVDDIEKKAPTDRTKDAQEEATLAQEALIESTKQLKELALREEALIEHMANVNFVPPPESVVSLAHLDIVDAYEEAKKLENMITESYREIKSAEAAMVRQMSFAGAKKLTDVAKNERPQFDAELLRESPRDKETFDKQKSTAMDVIREADSMVKLNEMLMVAAQEIVRYDPEHGDHSEKRSERLQRMYDLAALNQALHTAAAEDTSERSKDMAALMSGAASETDMRDSDKNYDPSKPAPGRVVYGAEKPDPSAPPLDYNTTSLIPGNVINLAETGAGVPTQWMYVNSWYTIGPFPNPDRINLRRRFPPESVVDLEATYIGKNDKPVKWVFEQARSSMRDNNHRAIVIPGSVEEYGIWYAYAEVFLDRAADLWVAVGSDDRSDVWLNDMHIWGSSNDLKVWRVNEGFRRVHFQKGRNRILARIENGWNAMAWSVSISLTDSNAL